MLTTPFLLSLLSSRGFFAAGVSVVVGSVVFSLDVVAGRFVAVSSDDMVEVVLSVNVEELDGWEFLQ